ncbi:unnamed protein product, partial [Medioppia subpectinata]
FEYQLSPKHSSLTTQSSLGTTHTGAEDPKAYHVSNDETSDETSDAEDMTANRRPGFRSQNVLKASLRARRGTHPSGTGCKAAVGLNGDKLAADRLKHECSWIGCDQRFRDNYALKAHIRLRHTNERPFKCSDCTKGFADRKHLREHQKIHTIGGHVFRCQLDGCSYETRREANLREHTLRHNNIRNYRCDQNGCDKCFVTNYELKVHKSHVHSDDRPFGCDWPGCEADYKSKQRLDDHKLSHLGVRQFACDFTGCAKSFVTKKKLTQHRNEHIKPYACSWPECGHSFGNNRALKAHTNAHEGVRPFGCPTTDCPKAFYSKPQLNSHIKSAHKRPELSDVMPVTTTTAAASSLFTRPHAFVGHSPVMPWPNTAPDRHHI